MSALCCHVGLKPEPDSWDEIQRLPTHETQKWITAFDKNTYKNQIFKTKI